MSNTLVVLTLISNMLLIYMGCINLIKGIKERKYIFTILSITLLVNSIVVVSISIDIILKLI